MTRRPDFEKKGNVKINAVDLCQNQHGVIQILSETY